MAGDINSGEILRPLQNCALLENKSTCHAWSRQPPLTPREILTDVTARAQRVTTE